MLNIFRKKGLVDIRNLYFPDEHIDWVRPWWSVETNLELRLGLQEELHKELSQKHPLWGLEPVVIGKCDANDDILVHLNNRRYACVHLVWNGKVDQFPESYPSVAVFENAIDLQRFLNSESEEYT